MKNIKGYYSWIHSLKNAAMQSQQKGFEMLKEQREEGGDPEVQREIDAWKLKTGRSDRRGGQNKKVDVEPVGDANDVDVDNDDGEMGDDIPGMVQPSKTVAVGRTRLPEIEAGTFPPPSAAHPPAQFPTPDAAAAEVSRLNAPNASRRAAAERAQTRAFHQQEATKAAKAAVEAARKAGKGPKGQEAAAIKAVEDYKNLRRQEMLAEPPERYTEVVTPEGHRMHLPMESVSQKIDRLLNG